ncbi:hypothetical protein N5I83_12325 [Klebsiella variicola]|uniref:hypothetical protein n=1 Tax=Klebsiella variicola TaxID=244366 RepID=UPI001FCBC09F|nr:hypothetical protein [Klebsiella variicola]MCJ6116000.1 hypothetical protein [Klebsiella variicola]MCW9273668.1 hypothetical protein [Klebsiella variicola]
MLIAFYLFFFMGGGVLAKNNPPDPNMSSASQQSGLDSDKHTVIIVESYSELQMHMPESEKDIAILKSFHRGYGNGGGEFIAVKGGARDNGGTICSRSLTGEFHWERRFIDSFDVTWFGAKGDSNEESSRINTIAIQNAINAAYVIGMAAVKFPVSSGFYYCDELTLLPGVSLIGSGRTKSLYGATVYLTNPSNSVVTNTFEGLWCKKTLFRLFSKNNDKSFISNVKFINMLVDGTNINDSGKTSGDALLIKNSTFDVHLNNTYIWNYLGSGYACIADNVNNHYLATGVFITMHQVKIFNCGFGIFIQGSAADSSDLHASSLLLDHNDNNLYIKLGQRDKIMGELHVYINSARFEWAKYYSIYNEGGIVHFNGWSLAPTSGGNKHYVGAKGKTFYDGRLSGQFERNENDTSAQYIFYPGVIMTGTLDNTLYSVSPIIENTCKSGQLKEKRLKVKFSFNYQNGYTFQFLDGYIPGHAPRYSIGGQYDRNISNYVNGNDKVSLGTGSSSLLSWIDRDGINLKLGDNELLSWVGHAAITLNSTKKLLSIDLSTHNDGGVIRIILRDALMGNMIDSKLLCGEIDIVFDVLMSY